MNKKRPRKSGAFCMSQGLALGFLLYCGWAAICSLPSSIYHIQNKPILGHGNGGGEVEHPAIHPAADFA